ncbi:hypothetical protein CDL15_Pgr011580 [Punica granatum]|nr:hypothetical protein CDL15_Pgr011580 [Punica granatum]
MKLTETAVGQRNFSYTCSPFLISAIRRRRRRRRSYWCELLGMGQEVWIFQQRRRQGREIGRGKKFGSSSRDGGGAEKLVGV